MIRTRMTAPNRMPLVCSLLFSHSGGRLDVFSGLGLSVAPAARLLSGWLGCWRGSLQVSVIKKIVAMINKIRVRRSSHSGHCGSFKGGRGGFVLVMAPAGGIVVQWLFALSELGPTGS